jgi:hypothetical protein
VIVKFFSYFDEKEKDTPLWFAYFDLKGGAINDVPMNAIACAHRTAPFFSCNLTPWV